MERGDVVETRQLGEVSVLSCSRPISDRDQHHCGFCIETHERHVRIHCPSGTPTKMIAI
jgi:hypothetical protein